MRRLKIKLIDHLVKKVDNYQRSHKAPGFIYAVLKKYGEDNGGQQAALLTYYGFLSLFPLLLVATSTLQFVLKSHPGIRNDVIEKATRYFPVLGEQLQSNVHSVGGAGIALAAGILLTLWGAKGIADVFQHSMNHMWGIPQYKRPGFPKGALKSVGIVILGGAGFIIASFLSGFAASIDRAFAFRVISSVVSVGVLFYLFELIYKWGLANSSQVSRRGLRRSALTAAIVIQILQIIGGYLVTHELSQLRHLYGAFAVTLGLLFWIYLQARIVVYAAEAGVVYDKKIWPRGLDQSRLTEADRYAYSHQAKKEQFIDPEKIDVNFKNGRG